MSRFYENLLATRRVEGANEEGGGPGEAKEWLKNLTADEVLERAGTLARGVSRGPGAEPPPELKPADVAPKGDLKLKPYTDPRTGPPSSSSARRID